jgi:glutamate N-acetyltransferase/amino-acid N-acetyltransferase
MTAAKTPKPVGDPAGFTILVDSIGIKDDTPDLMIVVSAKPATAAGMYTRSHFAGPSVELSRDVTSEGTARGVVVISKNAIVANGAQGMADARELRRRAARLSGMSAGEMVVASTGVIGRPYPMDRIEGFFDGAEQAHPEELYPGRSFEDAAAAIMTTDTHPKVVRARCGKATIVGIAKGVGMIEPDMATMLAFLFTDAEVGRAELDLVFRGVVEHTFNAVSIDTDTSTSDTAVIMANGLAGPVDVADFTRAVAEVCLGLTRMIAADGEGATKLLIVTVTGARDDLQAKRVAKAIVNSPLVKTAVHGADPNWGRVVMAIGKCRDDHDIDPERVSVTIGDVAVFPPAAGIDQLDAAAHHMTGDEVLITADLGLADGAFTVFGCDLSDGYVHINADYTT